MARWLAVAPADCARHATVYRMGRSPWDRDVRVAVQAGEATVKIAGRIVLWLAWTWVVGCLCMVAAPIAIQAAVGYADGGLSRWTNITILAAVGGILLLGRRQ